MKTLLKTIFRDMHKFGMIKGSFEEDMGSGLHPSANHIIEECDEFKSILQDLMDKKLLQVGYFVNDVLTIDSSMTFLKPLVIHYTICATYLTPSGPKSFTIQVPKDFSYKDNKAVPWKYDIEVSVKGGDVNQSKNTREEAPDVTNIAGIGGMTQSGRIYTPNKLMVKQRKYEERLKPVMIEPEVVGEK